MTQSYAGGNLAEVTGNPSVYCTHGGTDLGFLAPEVIIDLSPSIEPLHFAQAKGAYGNRTVEGDVPSVKGEMVQLTQPLLLKLQPDGVSLDNGNSIGHDGGYGTILTGVEAWTYFLHNISGLPKRLKFPQADLIAEGELSVGSGADDLRQGFNMFAVVKPTGDTNERLWRLYYDEGGALTTCTPSPADAAVGVAVNATVTLTFSAAVGADFRKTGLNNGYIYMKKADGTEALTSISWNAAGTVATLAHANFAGTTAYFIFISGELRDINGAKFGGDGATSGTEQIVNFTTV